MGKIMQVVSTLTDRYQTTIPEPIREALHLGKRDKISYEIDENGKVQMTRAIPEDPLIEEFLSFIASDIKKHPAHIQAISPVLFERAQSLVKDIEVDLDAPLSEKDE